VKKFLRIFAVLLAVSILAIWIATPAAAAPGTGVARVVDFQATPEKIVAAGAVLLAVLFDWLPGLKTWYDKLGDGQKRGLMAVLLLLIVGGTFGLTCAGVINSGMVCTGAGIEDAALLFALSIAINQGFHALAKP
jgi:hypothetical protein